MSSPTYQRTIKRTCVTTIRVLSHLVPSVILLNHSKHHFVFYRPQTKFAKVMFLHLSVHRGGGRVRVWQGGMHGRGTCMAGGHVWQRVWMVGGHAWWGACMVGGMHGRGGVHGKVAGVAGGHAWKGACMEGGMHGRAVHGRGHMHMHASPWQIPRDMVNEWAVCILLECILVSRVFNLSIVKSKT